MMKWINVKDELPKPFEVVWAYWRNREVLLACKVDNINHCEPEECWYSFEDNKCRWVNYWMRVESNLDKPEPPEEE